MQKYKQKKMQDQRAGTVKDDAEEGREESRTHKMELATEASSLMARDLLEGTNQWNWVKGGGVSMVSMDQDSQSTLPPGEAGRYY
jgi:hypothetical protein